MPYDMPHIDATLLDHPCVGDTVYDAIAANESDARVMSVAAYEVISRVVRDWTERPGVVCCKLDIADRTVEMFVHGFVEGGDLVASYSVSFDELVLAAARTARGYAGMPPSAVSAMLRELADQIDELSKGA